MAKPFDDFFSDVSAEGYDYDVSTSGATTPNDLGEVFDRAFDKGVEGMATDTQYFKGLFNIAVGDDEAAAQNIDTARRKEERNSGMMGELETFEEFVDNPTLEGFLTQAVKGTGQILPYAVGTVGGGLGGAVVSAGTKLAIKGTNKAITKRIVKDAFDKKLKGVATPEEERIANVAYRLAQRNVAGRTADKLTLRGGMKAGAFGQEFTSMSGSNLGENLDQGLSYDEAAIRSAGLAVPQALIGVKGEEILAKAIFKDLASVAKKRSTKEGSLFAQYAKDVSKSFLKGGVTESAAEAAQEGLSVANRFSIDEDYTAREALLRVGEGAFAGFFGGGSMRGAGTTAATSLQASGNVMGKARQFIEQAREQQVNAEVDRQQYGVDGMGFTTPEPQSSINAQIRSLLDKSTKRHSVWVAGPNPEYNASADSTGQIDIEGQTFYTRFIPGRGTIISRNADVAEAVANAEASDAALAEALGYSNTKPADGDFVVEVVDRDGNVAWQELASEETEESAYAAAAKQTPKGGSVRRRSIEEAMEDRKRLYEAEQGPQVKNIDVPDNVREAFMDQDVDESDAFIEDEGVTDEDAQGMDVVESPEYKNVGKTEKYKAGNGTIYEDTQSLREKFETVFLDEYGDIDWNNPAFTNMSDAVLRQALAAKENNPDTDTFVQRNEDGTYSIMQAPKLGQDIYTDSRVDGGDKKSLTQFVFSALAKAMKSRWANQKKVGKRWVDKNDSEKVTVDGKAVNLIDLVNDGQRMVSVEEKKAFEGDRPMQAKREGLFRMLSQLLSEKSKISIGGIELNNETLTQVIRESREYRQAYAKFIQAQEAGDTNAQAPERSPFLAQFDKAAGFADSKKVGLGKVAGVKPDTNTKKDALYTIFRDNDDKTAVLTGTKQQVLEYMEENNEVDYIIEREGAQNDGQQDVEIDLDTLKEEPDVGFSEPRRDEIGFDGRSETERMNDNAPDIKGYDLPASANAGAAALEYTITDTDSGSKSALVKNVARIARKTLQLANPSSIFTAEKILNATPEQLSDIFGNAEVAAYVQDVAQKLKDDPQGGGRYIGFKNAHIILVDESAMQNELQTAITVAHELGHALFAEEQNSTLRNPQLYNRLYAAFTKAAKAKNAPDAYKGKNGFEEWYADQVAMWANREYASQKQKGLVGATFKKIATKLQKYHRALTSDLKRRFGKKAYTTTFDGYIDEVIKRNRSNRGSEQTGAAAAVMPDFEQKIIVRKMAEASEKQNPGFVRAIQRPIIKMIRSKKFDPVYNFLFTSDSRLRKYAGDKVADMFYGRAQDSKGKGKTRLGILKATALEVNKLSNDLEDAIGFKLDSAEARAALDEAFSETATADLQSEQAKAIRAFFESVYDDYIEPSNTDIGRQENYAPRVLKLSEIHHNPEAFIQLIAEANPDENIAAIKQAVDNLVAYQQHIIDDRPIVVKGVDPAKDIEKALTLTRGVTRDKLKEKGYLEDSDVSALRYINHIVKRVEFNRHSKDSAGNSILDEEFAKLNPTQKEQAKSVIDSYFGYNQKPIPDWLRTVNSVGSVVQITALLGMAVIGSLPELAGPVIASKEFSAVSRGMKEIINTIRDRKEAERLARDLGLVTSSSINSALLSQTELDWMGEGARKFTDGFFRVTMLDQYTKFTRYFAMNMGIKFMAEHSNPDTQKAFSKRYLKELGITAEDFQAWEKSGRDFNTPEGKKVRTGIQRFVESSTLRPNAAERPVWASDPRYALVWQLKGFFYSYSKVIFAGVRREAQNRLEGASAKDGSAYAAMTGAAGIFALMGIATLPLAMAGMELREYAKTGLAWAIPGIDNDKNYFRTDDMSWSQYLGAAMDRAFPLGVVAIGQQMVQASDWGRGPLGALAVGAGPTAETLERMFSEGPSSTFKNRILPTGVL